MERVNYLSNPQVAKLSIYLFIQICEILLNDITTERWNVNLQDIGKSDFNFPEIRIFANLRQSSPFSLSLRWHQPERSFLGSR